MGADLYSETWMNPYEVLEIPQGSAPEDIRAAYHRLAKQWHPDRFSGDAKADAENRFRQLAEAFAMLKDVAPRKAPREANTPNASPASNGTPSPAAAKAVPVAGAAVTKTADHWFEEAKRCMECQDFDQAIALVQYAIHMDSQKGDYHALLAQLLVARGNPDNHALVRALQTAIQLNPKDADSLAMLSEVFQSLGMHARASGALDRLRTLKPKHKLLARDKGMSAPVASEPTKSRDQVGGKGSLMDQLKALVGRITQRS